MLAGCGKPLSPALTPALTPQRILHSDLRKDGGPSDWTLLYVSDASGKVVVYRYWQKKLDGTLSGFKSPKGECVDKSGDVFVTDSALQAIVEYHHGAKVAADTLKDSSYQPYACSSDFTTGNLAVANFETASSGVGNVAIYPSGSGKPAFFKPNLGGYGPLTCGYDANGNLLIATEYAYGSYEHAAFAMLWKGSKVFKTIELAHISESPFEYVTNVQWDGKYWAVTDNGNIQRFSIASSGNATYKGTVSFSDNWNGTAQVWLSGTTSNQKVQATQVVAAESYDVEFWRYPSGGLPYSDLSQDLTSPYGVTVSLKHT